MPRSGQIGVYRLIETLGRGAFSTAWLADRGEGLVVLKSLHLSVGNDESPRVRFFREIANLASLERTGLVRLLDAGGWDDGPYFVIPYIPGQSLANRLRTGPLSVSEAMHIFWSLARDLDTLHSVGFVHRDVKPENIIVANDGRATLIDFGLAAHVATVDVDEAVGTLRYASPEQLGVIHRAVESPADLYSLGAVLFEALTGSLPYSGTTIDEVLSWHASARTSRPSEFRAGIPETIDDLVGALLERDPNDRVLRTAGAVRKLTTASPVPLQHVRDWQLRGRPTCLGRDPELCAVQRHLGIQERATHGSVLVLGVPGMGRTTFLDAIELEAVRARLLVLRLLRSSDDLPFASLSQAISHRLAPLIAAGGVAFERARSNLRDAAGDFAPLLKRLAVPLEQVLGSAEASRALELTQDPTRFAEIIADFLAALARRVGGLLLLADDVDTLDAGTIRVLHKLPAVDEVGLVMSVDVQGGPRAATLLEQFRGALTIELGGLDAKGVRDLLEHVLGTGRCPDDLIDHVIACVGSLPFSVLSYARSLIDAGALELKEGNWLVRDERATPLALPRNATEALFARAETIPSAAHRVLGTLALVGVPVTAAFLADVLDVAQRELVALIGMCIRAKLVVVDALGLLRIVHPDLAQHLRAEALPVESQPLHARIAAVAAERTPDDPFLEARHRLIGLPSGDTALAVRSALLAGRRALSAYSNDVAYDMLSKALPYVREDDRTSAAYFEAFGEACTRTAHIDTALDAFGLALRASTSHMDTARIHMQVARVSMALWDADKVQQSCQAAQRSIMEALRTTSVGYDIVAQLDSLRATDPSSERWAKIAEVLGSTFALSGFMAWSSGRPSLVTEPREQLTRVCHLLGDRDESVELEAWLGYLCAVCEMPEHAERHGERALARARSGIDRAVEANAEKLLGWSCHVGGRYERHEELAEDAIQRLRRWIATRDLIAICNDLGLGLLMRGMSEKAERVARVGMEIADTAGLPSGMANIRATLASALAMRGELVEASALLDKARAIRQQRISPRDVWTGTWIAQHRMFHLFEQDEQGAPFEELRAEAKEIAASPSDWPDQMAAFFVLAAYLCGRRAERSHNETDLESFRKSLTDVRAVCTDEPLRRAHEQILLATFARIEGRRDDAEAHLSMADAIASQTTELWTTFEVLRERARLASIQALKSQFATDARNLARHAGWITRERAVLREFRISTSVPPNTAPESRTLQPTVGRFSGQARVFDSLLRVSLASHSTRDPMEQARAILDELLVAFGGERAFLFALASEGEIRRIVGRAGGGRDITETHGFATTLLRRVVETGEPHVIAGSEEGAVLGSKSAVAHDLRSIMAAPVRARDSLYGVVYIDSRVVRGLYHRTDLDVLVAMAAHIGASIESARVVRLEMAARELRKDLELSAAVQKLFFPRTQHTSIGSWRLAGLSRPATQCGGDWWWWEHRGESAVVILGDVTGHGAAPAILTASVASVTRSFLRRGAGLEEVLRAVHEELFERCAGEFQMQAVAMELFPDGAVSTCSAGGPPPLLLDGGGGRALVARGAPLGGSVFECGVRRDTINAGARLLAYSDGVTESTDAAQRPFGARRLLKSLVNARGESHDVVIARIDEDVDAFRGEAPALDDRTLVLIERA